MITHDSSMAVWNDGDLPANVRLGHASSIYGQDAFKRFFSRCPIALTLGDRSRADGVRFAIGLQGHVAIGHDCYLNDCIILAEQDIRIGNYVMIGWNTTISDSDFHPLAPADRILDAIALSPLAEGRPRPKVVSKAVLIGNDVFIGPACSILKGVSIGDGSFVEPGSVVTRCVPARSHVQGNPALAVSLDEVK